MLMWAKPASSYQAFFDSIILNSCINNFKIFLKSMMVIYSPVADVE
jgi:hypothetical protein